MVLIGADDHCIHDRTLNNDVFPAEGIRRIFDFRFEQFSRFGIPPARNRPSRQDAPDDPLTPYLFRNILGGRSNCHAYQNARVHKRLTSAPPSPHHFPPNSFFTASLTTFPSTRMPCAENFAMAFFITVPISFIVGDPISAMAGLTPAAISSSPATFGR